jgi:hypothetical protein
VAQPLPALVGGRRWGAFQSDATTLARYLRRLAAVRRSVARYVERVGEDHRAACRGVDAVISSLSAMHGPRHAAAGGVPHVWALLQPMTPTREYPQFLLHRGLPGAVNVLTHEVGESVYRRLSRGRGQARASGKRRLFGAAGGTIVYGISPTILPRPGDWPPNVAQFGDWHLDGAGEPLPSEVEAFLDAGPPPVFVHAQRIAGERFHAAAAAALRRLGLRALVSGWPAAEPLPHGVAASPPVSFDRLFPRVAAVVHHGGAGTAAAAARAGRPSLGIPGSFDQRFWCARLAALGAGAPPLPARRVDARRLERSLARLVGDPSLSERAASIARAVRAERGVVDTAAHVRAQLEGSA